MTTLNKAFQISIVVTSMISGSISCVASLTIIVMIFRSNLKLSTTYRRLIFGMSVFDLVQSFSQVAGALSTPKGLIWGAIGNDTSCTFSGWLTTIGICGAVFYSVSISIYFLSVVKFDMDEGRIKKYLEPFLHGVPIAYSLSVSTYIAKVDYFNPTTLGCWINGDNIFRTEVLKWAGAYAPVFSGFFFNCLILAMIWWTIYSQSKLMSQISMRGSVSVTVPSTRQQESEAIQNQGMRGFIVSIMSSLKTLIARLRTSQGDSSQCQNPNGRLFPSRGSNSNLGPLAARLSRPSRGSIQMMKEISTRATAFIIGYLTTYVFSIIYRMMELHSTGSTPPAVVFLARFFFPLQGFFNILIYTHPHVLTYRRNYDGTPWLRAFWKVLKSGGDSDQVGPNSRRFSAMAPTISLRNQRSRFSKERRESLRNEPAVLDIDESFVGNAERIQSSYNMKDSSNLVDAISTEEDDNEIYEVDNDSFGELSAVYGSSDIEEV